MYQPKKNSIDLKKKTKKQTNNPNGGVVSHLNYPLESALCALHFYLKCGLSYELTAS